MKNLFFILLLVLVVSCDKDQAREISDLADLDCSLFQTRDIEPLKEFLNPILGQHLPFITSTDDYGNLLNMNKFVDDLNETCTEMTFELLCYACIETFPPLSELQINFADSTSTILDIVTHDDRGLEVLQFHD